MMKVLELKNEAGLGRLASRLEKTGEFRPAEQLVVRKVIRDVRRKGDLALLAYARKFDFFISNPAAIRIKPGEIVAAYTGVPRRVVVALKKARRQIEAFQKATLPRSWSRAFRTGVRLGQQVRPLESVGLCVPGGEAPLVSSVLMTAVPARVAGVGRIVMCSPNRFGRGIDPALLVAADIAGVDEIYQVGGAQAVAAMAYGTRTIARVDKIVGPGSRWVTMAKKEVYGDVGIDSLAGPSEALVLADGSAKPAAVAAELISQAEHAGDETAVLVTTSRALWPRVKKELKAQIAVAPRRKIIEQSLDKHGLVILVSTKKLALAVANMIAPEHLQIDARSPESWMKGLNHAGAIFLGPYMPVAMGDFVAGPSHVLPTGRTARFSSGLSADDFVKKSSTLRYSRSALARENKILACVASAEGLAAHAASAARRLEK